MSTVYVSTKKDFERAKSKRPDTIIFQGEMAVKIKKVMEAKKTGKALAVGGGILAAVGAGTAIIGGIVAAPVTGGLSLGVTAAGVASASMHLTAAVGGVAIVATAGELAIVAGVIAITLGVSTVLVKDLLKHYDMEFSNGRAKFTRKD
jgi:hypothetical protein